MTRIARTGLDIANTSKITVVMWVYLSTEQLAPGGDNSLPLIEWGISEDDEPDTYYWVEVNSIAAQEVHPEAFGGSSDPAPNGGNAPSDSCTRQFFPRNNIGYTGAKTLRDSDLSFPVQMGQTQAIMEPNPPAAPGSAGLIHVTYTSFVWMPTDGVNPDTQIPLCEGGTPGISAGTYVVGTKYWLSFTQHHFGRFPCGIYVSKSARRVDAWIVSLIDNEGFYFAGVARSVNNAIVPDKWNMLFVTIDSSAQGTFPTTLLVNKNNKLLTQPSDDPYKIGINGLEVGLPKIPSDIERQFGSGLNQAVQYGPVCMWFGQAIENTPENLDKFAILDDEGDLIPNPDIHAASDAFGQPDIYLIRDNISGIEFNMNQGTAGDLDIIVGTPPEDFRPDPEVDL